MQKDKPDVLFLIRARLDTGNDRGVHQLRKDRRVLEKAAEEIERLRRLLDATGSDEVELPKWAR